MTRNRAIKRRYDGQRLERASMQERTPYAARPARRVMPAPPVRPPRRGTRYIRPERPERKRVRKNYIIHYMLFSLAAVAIVSILSVTVLFKANKVVFESDGECAYSIDEIMAAGGFSKGVNLIRFNAAEAEQNIEDKLILIDEVSIGKSFPSSLVVSVKGAKGEICVLSGGKYYTVSGKKRILEITDSRPDGPVITGYTPKDREAGDYLTSDDGDEEKTKLAFDLTEMVKNYDLGGVTEINLADRLDISMLCEGRVKVKLGAPTELNEKFTVAEEMLKSYIKRNERGVLRLSNPRKVTFKPDSDA